MYDLDTMIFDDTDRVIQFALKDSTGAPLDMTGGTYSFRLGEPNSSVATVTKTLTVTAPLLGECEVAFSAAETTALTAGRKRYSMRRTDGANHTVLQYGGVSVEKVI